MDFVAEFNNTASTMDFVAELNNMVSKPYIKVSDMEFGRQYKVLNVSRCTTKFGPKVSLELEDARIFLPSRYDKITDAALEGLNMEGNLYITNEGGNGRKSFSLRFSRTATTFYSPLF